MSPETITKIEGEQTRLRLARCPEAQAEAIAHHYTRLAAISLTLLDLVKLRRDDGTGALTEAAIKSVVETMSDAHLKDLGIPLEWSTKGSDALYRRPESSRRDLRLDSW